MATSNEKLRRAATYLLKVQESREDLLAFTHITMPHPDDVEDVSRSRYVPVRHHRVLAAALEGVDKGIIPRLIVTMPPRHGKSELCSKRFLAWYLGRNPYRSLIFGTYSEDFARDFGRDVRSIMQMPVYKQIFPGIAFRKGAASATALQTTEGGLVVFVGRGGAATGRGADLLLLDDLIKDAAEADSPTVRESAWQWFTRVAMTRLMTVGASVIIVLTRWHEDDIVGRLTDPENPHYSEAEARKWKIINLPFFADSKDDPLGRPVGETDASVLWPERFPAAFGLAQRGLNPRGFSALYQQNPTPEDGDFFTRDMVALYTPNQRPAMSDLRLYAASDHAVGTKQTNDASVFMIVGVDANDDIWILDVWWERAPADVAVEAIINIIRRRKPIIWWAEKGHISKSIGPFLRKRMREERVYATIEEVTPVKDKMTRAQSIRARMSMKKVRFPRGAPWLGNAIHELMKFPYGTFDDFVDVLSWIGLGLDRIAAPGFRMPRTQEIPPVGTFAWVKFDSEQRKKIAGHAKAAGGF